MHICRVTLVKATCWTAQKETGEVMPNGRRVTVGLQLLNSATFGAFRASAAIYRGVRYLL